MKKTNWEQTKANWAQLPWLKRILVVLFFGLGTPFVIYTSFSSDTINTELSTENTQVQSQTADVKARLAEEAERMRAASDENVPNDYYATAADSDTKSWVNMVVPELTKPSNFKTESPLCGAIHQNEMMTYSNVSLALLFQNHNTYSAMVETGKIQACPNITQTPKTLDFIQRELTRQAAISILYAECYKGSIGTDAQKRYIAEQSKNMLIQTSCSVVEATAKSYVSDTLRYPTNAN